MAGSGVGEGDLVVVVFAGALVQSAAADGVVADDAGEGVGEVEDLSLRVRGIGAAIERGDAGCIKRDGGDLVWEIFAGRKEIGIVDAVCGAVVGAGRCVDAETSGVVAGGEEKFVGGAGAEGVDVVERAGLVGTAVDARDDVVVRRREGIDLVVVEVNQAEADVVLLGGNDVEIAAVDLLLDGIVSGLKQVGCTDLKAWCRRGEGREQTDAVWAETIFGDDVAGKQPGPPAFGSHGRPDMGSLMCCATELKSPVRKAALGTVSVSVESDGSRTKASE